VYEVIAAGHVRRDVNYCDQIRAAARSAPSNIAEGFGRFAPREFARFLDIARASLMETHNHLQDGRDLGYLDAPQCEHLCHLADRAIGATTRLILYLRK
jgi:four helix bundle protein